MCFFPLRSTMLFIIILIWVLALEPFPGQDSPESQIYCCIAEMIDTFYLSVEETF